MKTLTWEEHKESSRQEKAKRQAAWARAREAEREHYAFSLSFHGSRPPGGSSRYSTARESQWASELAESGTKADIPVDTGIPDRKLNATGLFADPRPCRVCGAWLPTAVKVGRPRVTCSEACRRADAARRKRAERDGETEPVERGRPLKWQDASRFSVEDIAEAFSVVGDWLSTAESEVTPFADVPKYRTGKPVKSLKVLGSTDGQPDGSPQGEGWLKEMGAI